MLKEPVIPVLKDTLYIESAMLLKRVHRIFLLNIKMFLSHWAYHEINPTQALIIYHIGPHLIKASEIIAHYFYDGANPSYNIKKIVQEKYVISRTSAQDRRVILLSLSSKGKNLYQIMEDFFTQQQNDLKKQGVDAPRLLHLIEEIKFMESYWKMARTRTMPLKKMASSSFLIH